MRYFLLVLALNWTVPSVQSADSQDTPAIRVTLHDSKGLSLLSTPDHRLQLNLVKSTSSHMHLRISNVSDKALTLWKPYCPQGDQSIVVEFRDPENPLKVFLAKPSWWYSGGMGVPKVFTLAGHDDCIVSLDFASDLDWTFPIRIPNDSRRELEIRVSYRSKNLTDEDLKRHGHLKIEKVWAGEFIGDWQKISVRNSSGKAIGGEQ